MWGAIASFLGGIIVALVDKWLARQDAKRDAQAEMASEIAHADRKKANEIRDRIDGARLGGGMHPDANDTRGYRD